MTTAIEDLKLRRARAWQAGRDILDGASRARRHLTGEERAAYERAEAELDRLDDELRSAEAAHARAPYAHVVQSVPAALAPEYSDELTSFLRGERGRTLEFRMGQYRRVHQSDGTLELRDLATTAAATGGNTVPTDFHRELIEYLTEYSGVLRLNCTVHNTTGGNPLEIPKVATNGTAAIVGEGTALAEADPSYGKVTLNTWKYGQLLQVTREMLDDSGVDVRGHLSRNMADALSAAYGPHFMTGTGSNQPQGMLTSMATGVTGQTAATGIPSADNLIDMVHSVAGPYRRRAQWLWKDTTLAGIRKIKDSTGRYLYEPSLQAGVPDQLIGFPVITDAYVPTAGTAVVCGAFGDFSGYHARFTDLRLERSDDYAFANDIVTFRAVVRCDGDLVDANAAKVYKGGAS